MNNQNESISHRHCHVFMVTRCCLSIRTLDMTNPGALMARVHEVDHHRSVLYVTQLRQQCVGRNGLFSIPLLVLTRQIRSMRHTPTTDNSWAANQMRLPTDPNGGPTSLACLYYPEAQFGLKHGLESTRNLPH